MKPQDITLSTPLATENHPPAPAPDSIALDRCGKKWFRDLISAPEFL